MSESQTTPDIRTFQAEDLLDSRSWPEILWVGERELPEKTTHLIFGDPEWGQGIAAFANSDGVEKLNKQFGLEGRPVVKSLDQLVEIARAKEKSVLGVFLVQAKSVEEFCILDAVYVR